MSTSTLVPEAQVSNGQQQGNSDDPYGEAFFRKKQAREITISPELASAWLKRNHPRNRPLSQVQLKYLVGILNRGEQLVVPDAIGFDEQGYLINGRHRLTACVQTGRPITCLVATQFHKQAIDVTDSGKSRSHSDRFGMQKEKHSSCLAATLSLVVRTREDGTLSGMTHRAGVKYSFAQLQAALNNYPNIRDAVAFYANNKPLHALGSGSLMSYAYWRLLQLDPKQATNFFTQLASGSMLMENSPIFRLRERLLMYRVQRRQPSFVQLLSLIFKAWNMYRAGKECKLMTIKNEEQFSVPR